MNRAIRAFVLAGAIMLAWMCSGVWTEPLSASTWPKSVLGTGAEDIAFVDNQLCEQCHPQSFQDWKGSHHEQAMQLATEKTVLGDFNQVSFTHNGVTSRFFKKDGRFVVHTEGPDGQMSDFDIAYTFGVEPLQQYLIPLSGGRLQSLTIAWDTHKKKWFHLYPDEAIKPGNPLHWTGSYQTWNGMCAECHSTNLQKNYDFERDVYQTTWSAINVSCQACHGPGQRHVDWARNQSPPPVIPGPEHQAQSNADADDRPRRAAVNSRYKQLGLVVDLSSGSGRVETCARCHARRHPISVNDQHSRPLLDDFVPAGVQAGLYHVDGQILDEVYVYGSYLQSKMHQAGVQCTDCHQAHSLQLRAEGNALCGQCHQSKPNPRFPSLTVKSYDTPAHHFHPVGSPGAQCVNCHMPSKTYMVIDPRRDHSFRIPRPDLSAKLGVPDACTSCHLGRTARWAAGVVTKWYGKASASHFADSLAAGRRGRPEALPKLTGLAEASDQPAIIRATALELLRQYGAGGTKAIVRSLSNDHPLIRTAAAGGLLAVPPRQRLAVAARLLTDPIRAVRLEAARTLADVPADLFSLEHRRAFDAALEEYIAAQLAQADTPAAHLNLAVLKRHQGQLTSAEQSYQTALKLDPGFLPARFNLSTLYNEIGQNTKAEQILRDGIQLEPNEGELYYSLGLLLAEEKRLSEAADALGQAAALLPLRARVYYNYGLALQHLGRRSEAEVALRTAHQVDTQDANVVEALTIFYIQGKQWDTAEVYAEQLVRLYPGAPQPRQLLLNIRQHQRK